MVFFINWDDNGLGFLFSGWNCFFPCPYMNEDTFPPNFKWSKLEERGVGGTRMKVIARKEPGPGFIGCILLLLPPKIFTLPCFLYKTTATSMTFIKRKNDHVDCDYRIKYFCTERRLFLYNISSAFVQSFNVKHSDGGDEIVYILCIKHSGGIFEYRDIALSNIRWKDVVTDLSIGINDLIASRPF